MELRAWVEAVMMKTTFGHDWLSSPQSLPHWAGDNYLVLPVCACSCVGSSLN